MIAHEQLAQRVKALRLRTNDETLPEEARIEAALALLALYEEILESG